jgi:hypothetical protein
LLVGCVAGLLLTNALGFWWYRNSVGQQTMAKWLEQCQKPIQSEKSGSNPIDVNVIATAEEVNQACEELLKQEQSTNDRATFLKQNGKALLLMGNSSQTLGHQEDAKDYLGSARQSGSVVRTIEAQTIDRL